MQFRIRRQSHVMPNLKPYRTKAQKAEARRTARQHADGAWRSNAPLSIHGEPGECFWDADHKTLLSERRPTGKRDAAK
jgi:hypothetical protein